MTDRVQTLTVVLDGATRTDDAEGLMEAIGRLRGVSSVHLGPVSDPNTFAVQARMARQIRERAWAWADELEGREVEP